VPSSAFRHYPALSGFAEQLSSQVGTDVSQPPQHVYDYSHVCFLVLHCVVLTLSLVTLSAAALSDAAMSSAQDPGTYRPLLQ